MQTLRVNKLRPELHLQSDEAAREVKDLPEYDLHTRGMRVDDATSELERLVARARNGNARVFAYKRSPNPGIVFIAV